MSGRVLVAGIGNIFLGDDGFGVEVANRLLRETFSASVRVADFGIRGLHLAYELLDGYDAVILIDAAPRGGSPGSLYVIEHDPEAASSLDPLGATATRVDAHGMDPVAVLALLQRLGGSINRVLVVGCEPLTIEEGIGLSEPVAAAVDEAARVVSELVAEVTAETPVGAGVRRSA